MDSMNNTPVIDKTLYNINNIPNICKVLNVLPMQRFTLKNSIMDSYIDYDGNFHMLPDDDIFFSYLVDSINDLQSIKRFSPLSEHEYNFINTVHNVLPNAQFFKIGSNSPVNINFKFYDVSGNHLSSFYFTDRTAFPYLSKYIDFDSGFSVKQVVNNKNLVVYPKTSSEFTDENVDYSKCVDYLKVPEIK